jgi:hypothetical protein
VFTLWYEVPVQCDITSGGAADAAHRLSPCIGLCCYEYVDFLSNAMPREGLEPSRLSTADFESAVSANSTTRAYGLRFGFFRIKVPCGVGCCAQSCLGIACLPWRYPRAYPGAYSQVGKYSGACARLTSCNPCRTEQESRQTIRSGRPGSNRRQPRWQRGALPTELRPQKVMNRCATTPKDHSVSGSRPQLLDCDRRGSRGWPLKKSPLLR